MITGVIPDSVPILALSCPGLAWEASQTCLYANTEVIDYMHI